MASQFALLAKLTRDNQNVIAAWFDPDTEPPTLHVICQRAAPGLPQSMPPELENVPIQLHHHEPLIPLVSYDLSAPASNDHQQCQNEPVQLGTQIQPSVGNWLGTAGAPVKWLDADEKPHWGILSNWHVMAAGREQIGLPQHQPNASGPELAKLADWDGPKPNKQNLVDAAIADALIDDLHTISPKIIGIGKVGPTRIKATKGLAVEKAGRTTAVTVGTCIATGAAVNVNYGGFTAQFVDQDIFEPYKGPFSAPGDSGSLIVDKADHRPCSLLFAGSAQITIGNPIRHVVEALNLVFPFH